MPADPAVRRAIRCRVKVGMNPDMPPSQRHGTVWFDVSGFGRQKRHFVVNSPDELVKNVTKLARTIAQQVMLLDPTLPKRERHCKPLMIDVVGSQMRRVLELDTMRMTMEQKL